MLPHGNDIAGVDNVNFTVVLAVHPMIGLRKLELCEPRRTSLITACRPPRFLVDNICDPPVAVNSSFHASVAAHLALVLSPLRAQQFGILCVTV